MTIICSACDMAYNITTDDAIVACPSCGQRTFSPGADDRSDERDDEDKDAAQRAAGEGR